MIVIKKNNKYFFFEDDAYTICESHDLRFINRFDDNVILDEIAERYDRYLDGVSTNHEKLFLENKLTTDDTGLKYALWVDPAGEERNVSHNSPRIKVIFQGKKYPLLFLDEVRFADGVNPPKELERCLGELEQFVHDNKRELLAQWFGHYENFETFKNQVIKNQSKKNKS